MIYTPKPAEVLAEGIVTVSVLDPNASKKGARLRKQILALEKRITSASEDELRHLQKRGYELMQKLREVSLVSEHVEEFAQSNLVVTAGVTAVTQALSNNITAVSAIAVNYAAVGSGTTTPAAADVQLTTESFRKTITSLNYISGSFFGGMYIDYTESSGTYYEGGVFINASATVNSGTILNHVLLNSPTGIVKTTAQVLTINYQITFTPV